MNAAAATGVVIPLSKGKLVLLILGAFGFVAGSLWLWSIADEQRQYNPLYVKAVAVAGVLFFGLCGIYGCLKVFDTRPGLIIDDQGIVDNSSAVAAGRILWDEVVALNVSVIAGQRILTIVVADPQKFMKRGNWLRRMMNAANTRMMGSPINISANSLALRFDELLQMLTAALERHRAAGRVSG